MAGWRSVWFKAFCVLGFILAINVVTAPAANAASAGAKRYISTVGKSVVKALAVTSPTTRARRFHGVFNRYANVKAVAQFALGKYSKKLTGAQRSEYYRLSKRYIVNTLFEGLYGVQVERVDITGCGGSGRFEVVATNFVLATGENYPVKWRLVRRGRSYQIVDLNVFGIWFALIHRTEFSHIISAGGGKPTVLLAHLRKKSTQPGPRPPGAATRSNNNGSNR